MSSLNKCCSSSNNNNNKLNKCINFLKKQQQLYFMLKKDPVLCLMKSQCFFYWPLSLKQTLFFSPHESTLPALLELWGWKFVDSLTCIHTITMLIMVSLESLIGLPYSYLQLCCSSECEHRPARILPSQTSSLQSHA